MPQQGEKPFYVSTPIYYVTAAPSIGSAYTTVAADMLNRWHQQRGEATFFLTGTDEHGQKVLQAAEDNGATPQEWTDQLVATEWQPVLEVIDAKPNDFIRTTQERHTTRVQQFWQRLYDAGEVYEGQYQGPYCVACEEFKLPSELLEGDLCPIHERAVEQLSETNYFFPLSKYAERLLALYEANPTFVQPESARNEVIAFVKQGLEDLSISRSTFDWGIAVPWDSKHVFYVWIDALLNYWTAVDGKSPWPASVHLVGKDILRFHAVIWPAMLMAAGVDVPHQVFAHGWLLVGGQKMSKSRATAIRPATVTDHFGSDAYRYYFLRAISFGSDGSFSWEHMTAVYTSELANGYGNLASRVTAMIGKYFDGRLPEASDHGPAEDEVAAALAEAVSTAESAIDRLALHEAIEATTDFVAKVNLYLSEQQPWKVAKEESARDRLATILYTAAESLRAVAVLYNPVMPKTSALLWGSLGAEAHLGALADQAVQQAGRWGQLPAGSEVTKGAALFPRLPEDS